MNAPIALCMLHDPKGFSKEAISGKVENDTGITALYFPFDPVVTVCTGAMSA
jgi:adenylylsulfate kinase-like enzyme